MRRQNRDFIILDISVQSILSDHGLEKLHGCLKGRCIDEGCVEIHELSAPVLDTSRELVAARDVFLLAINVQATSSCGIRAAPNERR